MAKLQEVNREVKIIQIDFYFVYLRVDTSSKLILLQTGQARRQMATRCLTATTHIRQWSQAA